MSLASSSTEPPPVSGTSARSSYGHVLKVSAIVGGASGVQILLGIVRTKVIALLLGPGGMGLVGMLNSVLDIAKSLAGMGINSSGVRQIAEAVGSGQSARLGRTVMTLRRTALILGVGGGLLLLILSTPVAHVTFGNADQAGQIALLALAVCFGAVSGGQAALIQGMRRIADLARMSMLGSLIGTVASIVLVYWLREKGIALFLVVVAGAGTLTSWWYARKIPFVRVELPWGQVFREARGLLHLGLVFMSTAFMGLGVAYVVRVLVARNLGLEAAGHYHAAWALAGLYVGFILQAMGADFYPRLTAAAADHRTCNQLVNEQAEVALLLAGPGVLATLTFAPVVIEVFYSAEFGPAVELLRWSCLGMFLRVASWPMGFIILAKGASRTFFLTELAAHGLHVLLVALLVSALGLKGVGLAFVALYLIYLGLVYFVVRRMTGFRWSGRNLRLFAIFLPLLTVVFACTFLLPTGWAIGFGLAATLAGGCFALRALCQMVSPSRLPRPVLKLLALVRITPNSHG